MINFPAQACNYCKNGTENHFLEGHGNISCLHIPHETDIPTHCAGMHSYTLMYWFPHRKRIPSLPVLRRTPMENPRAIFTLFSLNYFHMTCITPSLYHGLKILSPFSKIILSWIVSGHSILHKSARMPPPCAVPPPTRHDRYHHNDHQHLDYARTDFAVITHFLKICITSCSGNACL